MPHSAAFCGITQGLQPAQKGQVAGKSIQTSKHLCKPHLTPPSPQILRDLCICNINHKISNGRDALVSLLPAKQGFTPYKIFPDADCSKNCKDLTRHWKPHYFWWSRALEARSFLISFHIVCNLEESFKSDCRKTSNLNFQKHTPKEAHHPGLVAMTPNASPTRDCFSKTSV